MPIGGFVITVDPDGSDAAVHRLKAFPQIEIHGQDEKGNVVAVIETETSSEMEQLTTDLQHIESVLSVGITFFDAEDEIENIHKGLLKPTFSFGRKGEKPKGSS